MSKKTLLCDQPQSLHEKTLFLYLNRSRKMTVKLISRSTGLPVYWLKSFAHSKGPSVNRVQILYEFLAKVEIDIAA